MTRLSAKAAVKNTMTFAVVRAIWRFIALWRYRIGLEPSVRTCYLGHKFIYPAGSNIGSLIEQGEEWDPAIRIITDVLVPRGTPNICDVGSNIGATVLQVLLARPAARVMAFEPSTRFRPFLRSNLHAAGAGTVLVSDCALGDSETTAVLFNNSTTASAAVQNYDGFAPRGSQSIKIHRLDSVFPVELRPLTLLRIDADGYDFDVLRGAERILREDKPALVFEFAVRLTRREPLAELQWLQRLGYERFLCLDARGRAINIEDDPTAIVRGAAGAERSWSGCTDLVTVAHDRPCCDCLDQLAVDLRHLK